MYISHLLFKTEHLYHIPELEITGLVWVAKKARTLLQSYK